ncbi:CxxH/CxxC protein [Heyndrickxia oleronia]|uniref:CxxH/CxxC protein n=1 Tax=Heyndrickxia oleronia TaxID=38875 RepID=UPI00203CA547|nr:CxxH/CxxC protein [Heyndrickxia oleronia]
MERVLLKKGVKSMIYACAEHVEYALEIATEQRMEAPNFEKVDEKNNLSTSCEYCKNPAIYLVGN